MSRTNRPRYPRLALFSYGFRPFFLLAMLLAAGAIVLWMGFYDGVLTVKGPFSALDWHIHEMLFGYTSAVIAGFIFTALPNWTGREPVRGWPLAVLALLWVIGRIAVAGAGDLDATSVMIIDCAFLAAIGVIVVKEIIMARNWRNLMVAVPITLLFASNICFHLEAATQGNADFSRRLGFSAVLFLIMLIGGRIIPAFTRNWLKKVGPGPLPVQFNRFDAVCIGVSALTFLAWTLWPETLAVRTMFAVTAALHLLRLSRWQGYRIRRSALLLMLHIAYGFVPFGLLALSFGNTVAGFHLLGIGAVGGMTMAVMIRASLGHTGQLLNADWMMKLAFALLIAAALIRAFVPSFQIGQITGLWVAAIFWTGAYLCALARMGPWLLRHNIKT